MGLQLILCVETNKKTQSDYIYIKETIDHFYKFDPTQVKISPVYEEKKEYINNVSKEKLTKNNLFMISNLIKSFLLSCLSIGRILFI